MLKGFTSIKSLISTTRLITGNLATVKGKKEVQVKCGILFLSYSEVLEAKICIKTIYQVKIRA
jgi:hypothetical protein